MSDPARIKAAAHATPRRQHHAREREQECHRVRAAKGLAEHKHADRGSADRQQHAVTPADAAGTCFRPVIHSHTVTMLAASA